MKFLVCFLTLLHILKVSGLNSRHWRFSILTPKSNLANRPLLLIRDSRIKISPESIANNVMHSSSDFWISSLSANADAISAIDEIIDKLAYSQVYRNDTPQVLIFFISSVYEMTATFDYDQLFAKIRNKLPFITSVIGCTTGTAIGQLSTYGETFEAESRPSISAMLGSFGDGIKSSVFSLSNEALDGSSTIFESGSGSIKEPSVNIIFASESCKSSLAKFITSSQGPGIDIFGSFASSVTSLQVPRMFTMSVSRSSAGEDIVQVEKLTSGLVCLSLSGDIAASTVLVRSSLPVGPLYSISEVAGSELLNIKRERSGRSDCVDNVSSPLVQLGFLLDSNELTTSQSFRLKQDLLVGLVDRLPQHSISIADSTEYFAQKPIDLNPNTGSITLPHMSGVGSAFQFCIKDPTFARRDLRRALRSLRGQLLPRRTSGWQPVALLHLASSQRGNKLYRYSHWESAALRRELQQSGNDRVPIAGFYSEGVFASCGATPIVAEADALFAVLYRKSAGSAIDLRPSSSAETYESLSPTDQPEDVMTDEEVALFRDDVEVGDGSSVLVSKRDTDSASAVRVASMDFVIPEKAPQPKNVLESLVWEREREVDRLRERFQLSRALMQVKRSEARLPKRDFVASIRDARASLSVASSLSSSSSSVVPVVVEVCRGSLYNDGVVADSALAVAEIAKVCAATTGVAMVGANIDTAIFRGTNEDLESLKLSTSLPVLCNDFVVYAYQIFQAKSSGADAVKLMAAVLSPQDLSYLAKICRTVGIAPVVVVSSTQQLLQVLAQVPAVAAICVTSRNMKIWKIQSGKAGVILSDPAVKAAIQAKRDVDPEFLVLQEGFADPEEVASVDCAAVDAVILGEELLRDARPDVTFAQRLNTWMPATK